MEESTVKSRLLDFLRANKISQTEFTRALGVSPTYVGAMRKGIPADRMKKICELYPGLNRDWLLYGEGEMMNKEIGILKNGKESEYETLLLPVEAFAGGLQMWSDGIRASDCQRIISPISGVDFAIPVRGDSMEPKFHPGSTLLIKRINEKAFIPWGHPMVIDTENGVLIKNLYPDNDKESFEECVVAESLNPKYPPFKIPVSSIYGLYRVMGTVDIFTNL